MRMECIPEGSKSGMGMESLRNDMKNLKTISITLLLFFCASFMLYAYLKKKESDHTHQENLQAHHSLDAMRVQLDELQIQLKECREGHQ